MSNTQETPFKWKLTGFHLTTCFYLSTYECLTWFLSAKCKNVDRLRSQIVWIRMDDIDSDGRVRFGLVFYQILRTTDWTTGSVLIAQWTLNWTIGSGRKWFGSSSARVRIGNQTMYNFFFLQAKNLRHSYKNAGYY